MSSSNGHFRQDDDASALPPPAPAIERWLSADGARWRARVPSPERLDERARLLSGTASPPLAPTQPGPPAEPGASSRPLASGGPPPSPRRGPLLAAMAGIAALLIVSLFAVLLYNLGSARKAMPSATPRPSASTGPTTTPSPTAQPGSALWQQHVIGNVSSQPAVNDGMVFFGTSGDNQLWALNAKTGAIVWSVATANPVMAPVIVANGLIIVNEADSVTFANSIAAYRESNGNLVWSVQPTDAGFGPPVVADGAVIADLYTNLGPAALLEAFALASGKHLWTVTLSGTGATIIIGHATPAADGGVVFAAETTGGPASNLYAIRISNGALLWQVTVEGDSITAVNGYVYVGGSPDTVNPSTTDLAKVDESDGKVIWHAPVSDVGTGGIQTPTVANGVVYFGTDTGTVYAFETTNGHQIWTYTVGSNIMSAPVVAGGSVYIGPYYGRLVAIDAASGTLRWQVDFGGGLTMVAKGVVYAGYGPIMYALQP